MAYICTRDGKCSTCEHYRYDKDENRYSCFASQDNMSNYKTVPKKTESFIVVVEYDDDIASKYCETNGYDIDSAEEFIKHEFGWLEQSGISLITISPYTHDSVVKSDEE